VPAPVDLAATARALERSGDAEVARLARTLRSVSGPRYRPNDQTDARRQELERAVRGEFPTPFAARFASYVVADAATASAIERYRALTPDAAGAARKLIEGEVSRTFNSSFNELWGCWRQIVRFVPFVLLAALQRIDDGLLHDHAGQELKRALLDYRRAYAVENSERRVEAFQRDLLVSLLRVFRKLEAEGVLPADFIFAPLLGSERRFSDLFPERFDAALLFLQQVRNRIQHGEIGDRYPDLVEPLPALCRLYFYELLALLEPLSHVFALGYVESLEASTDAVSARVSLFVGLEGPVTARYLASPASQLDHYEFEESRLYLIVRARASDGERAETLSTADYLDLTPFLIAERLQRAQPAERDVLALDQYGAIDRLVYLELAGRAKTVIERLGAAGDIAARLRAAHNDDLFGAVAAFVARIAELTAMVTIRDASSAKLADVRERLWEIGKESTGGVLESGRFSSDGRLDATAPRRGGSTSYDPDLYVEPREGEALRRFLDGERRAIVLTGGSGYGKSNLLAHLYLERCRAERPAVFLTGRLLRKPSFRDDLVVHLTSLIYGGWTLEELDAFLQANAETLTVFVDAVNEYTGDGGPLELLADMVRSIRLDERLARCRFVIAVRTETWAQYKQDAGERPLDQAVFESASGDAVTLGTFDEDARRRALFERYRTFYALRPDRYADLSPSVRALIARPYLMSVVAETYSNRDSGPAGATLPRRIPRALGYLTVFATLTARRAAEAQVLLPPGDERRDALPDEMLEFFAAFTRLLYRRLARGDELDAGATPDALPRDVVDKAEELQPFVREPGNRLSVLQAALQSGLLMRTTIPRRNALGKLVDGKAYAFFHDQYTQFWLAQYYRDDEFADVDAALLADPGKRRLVAERVVEVVRAAIHTPILGGGLAYWLDELQQRAGLGPVVDLLNDVAALQNGLARLFVASALSGLVIRDAVRPEVLYATAFERGTPRLRRDLGAAFLEYWPDLDRDATRAFIESVNLKRDTAAIEALAESFAAHFINEAEGREGEQSRVLDFLRDVIPGIEPRTLPAARHAEKYLAFMFQFCAKSILGLASDPASMRAFGTFLRAKLGLVIGLIVRLRRLRGPLLEQVRRPLWGLIERAGFSMWNNAISQRGTNDLFFVSDGGVNQNHIERAFMPYVCALHNREFSALDLSEGSEFRRMVLRMLDFRPQSAIGYTAMTTLPFALGNDWPRTRALVDELLGAGSPSALFFGSLLLVNLTYTEPSLCVPALDYVVDDLLPTLLERGVPTGDLLLDGVGIAEQDPERLWPALERGLRRAFEALEAAGEPAAIERLGTDLLRVNFFQHAEIAKRTIRLVAALGFLEPASRWRPGALKILAGMRARNPLLLRTLLEGRDDADELVHATSGLLDAKTEEGARAFGYETSWNPLIQRSLAGNTKLRYLLLKYLVAGLAGCNSVPQYTRSWRAFVVESIAAYFGPPQPDAAYARLTREDWEGALETPWRADAGEPWPPRDAAA
jgi:hypothetical protein